MRVLRNMGGAFLATALVAGLTVAAGTSVASAASPSIALSKSTGVVGNEVITVSGKGFPHDTTVVICQYAQMGGCVMSASGPYRVTAQTNSDGVFPATDYTLEAGDVGVDAEPCGVPPGPKTGCYMQVSGGGDTVDANLKFALPAVKVSLVPADGVVGNDVVGVSGTGFPAGDSVNVLQCSATYVSSQSESDCDTSAVSGEVTNSVGYFATHFKVLEGGTYSDADGGTCLPADDGGSGYCELAVTDLDNTVMTASSQFNIAPFVLNVAPEIFPNKDGKNGPATGLVTVSGMPTGDEILAIECAPISTAPGCDPDAENELFGISTGTGGTVEWQPYRYPKGTYPAPANGHLPILTEDTTPAFQSIDGEATVTPSTGALVLVADLSSSQQGAIETSVNLTIR